MRSTRGEVNTYCQEVGIPIATCPVAISLTCSLRIANWRSSGRARSASSLPLSVSSTPPCVRVNSCVPISCSSAATWRDSAGCDRCRSAAALLMLPSSVKSSGRELKRRSTLQLDSRGLDDPRPAVGVSLQHFAQLHGGPRERFHLELPCGVLHLVAADGRTHRPFPTLHHRIGKLRRGE